MFAPFGENNLVVPAQLLLAWGSTLPETGDFQGSCAPYPGLAGSAPVGGWWEMVWLLWASDMAQVSRAHKQTQHLQRQCNYCIFTAGKGTEVPFPAPDQEFRNDSGGQKAAGKAGSKFIPLPVYERGFLVCEMARGRQKLLAQPSLGGCQAQC